MPPSPTPGPSLPPKEPQLGTPLDFILMGIGVLIAWGVYNIIF